MKSEYPCDEIQNISQKNRSFAIMPKKTGSRSFNKILDLFDFDTYFICGGETTFFKNGTMHNHINTLMKNHLEYEMLISCRNPYAIYASLFRLYSVKDRRILSTFKLKNEFEEYLRELIFVDQDEWLNTKKEKVQDLVNRPANYRIRLENLWDSLMSVPFIANSEHSYNGNLEKLLNNKTGNYKEMDYFKHIPDFFPERFQDYYNQDLADMVYENFTSLFVLMDYPKDSWMS